MNKELFVSMREQMRPSEEARAALEEKLAAPWKKRVPAGRYAAIAACLAAVIAAAPAYNFIRDSLEISIDPGPGDRRTEITEPHGYVLADELGCWPAENTATGNADAGSGDQDQDMTPGELTDNMLEAGFSREDADGYLALGWQMTWAKWWKFHRQSEESGERTLEALLDFSREEGLAVNTGEAPELPGGAYVSDQGEAIMAYQNLMDRFKADYGPDKYPEWYGGAYIDERAGLVVNIAQGYEPEGKELFFQIQEWAGSDRVSFGSSREPLNYLRFLQDRALTAMEALGLAAGCGINEETGMVELTLPEADEEALWQLARLDPTNAILVIVARTAATDGPAEEPVQETPSVSHIIQPGGTPEVPDNAIADEDGVLAWEPQN